MLDAEAALARAGEPHRFLPEGNTARELDAMERRQIELAKEDVLRKVQLDRELLAAARATDPFDESTMGKMAGTLGGSLASMAPVLFLGPQGAVLTGIGYSNMEYETIRQKYPDMPLERVRELSLISAVAQASLDAIGV